MKIDIVVGNPPYNNDLYLDFVQMGHQIAGQYTLMITPAKWQAKGGAKNEAFRHGGEVRVKDPITNKTKTEHWEAIVPHMSKIVFYPDCKDVFDIQSQGGIAYYSIDKNINVSKELKVICSKNSNLSGVDSTDGTCIYTKHVRDIISKLNINKSLGYKKVNPIDGKYNIAITNVWVGGGFLSDKGNTLMLISPYWQKSTIPKNITTSFIYVADTQNEAESFISYLNTRCVRFGLFINQHSLHFTNDETWRFVPDPGTFNKIFEDKPLPGYTPNEQGEYTDKDGNVHCSLYVKYKLTPEEINIIESVIKERK